MIDESIDFAPPRFLDDKALDLIAEHLLEFGWERKDLLARVSRGTLNQAKSLFPDTKFAAKQFSFAAELDEIARSYCEATVAHLPASPGSPRRAEGLLSKLAKTARARSKSRSKAEAKKHGTALQQALEAAIGDHTARMSLARALRQEMWWINRSPHSRRGFAPLRAALTPTEGAPPAVTVTTISAAPPELIAKLAAEAAGLIRFNHGDDRACDIDEQNIDEIEARQKAFEKASELGDQMELSRAMPGIAEIADPKFPGVPIGNQPLSPAKRGVYLLADLFQQVSKKKPTYSCDEDGEFYPSAFAYFLSSFFLICARTDPLVHEPSSKTIKKAMTEWRRRKTN